MMLIHNGLLLRRKLVSIQRSRPRTVIRMNLSQRIQHALLGMSFTALALSGFALRFPDSWISRLMGSSEPFRRTSHRVAAVVMLAVCAYHFYYICFTTEGRKLVRDFRPGLKDVKDVFTNLRYLVGLSGKKVPVGRFGYAEKMEYWAVVWGTIIMGGTGMLLWFKIYFTQELPRWTLDVATNIHYYEAILACLAIMAWHFYHVIFDPDIYPANLAAWDGRVSEQWQHEEHPLENIPGECDERSSKPQADIQLTSIE